MTLPLSTNDHLYTRLVAWRGPHDPTTSDYSMGGDSSSDLQVIIWNGTMPYWRRAAWDGSLVTGLYQSSTGFIISETIVNRGGSFYLTFTVSGGSPSVRIVLRYTGMFEFLSWNSSSSSWKVVLKRPSPTCDSYAYCGPFGYCDDTETVPKCKCFSGFEPDGANFSQGCRRKDELKCGGGDSFSTLSGMKTPDKFVYVRNRSFDQCTAECSHDCSCSAYAYANLKNGSMTLDQSRCLIWLGELVDTEKYGDGSGENLYLRLASSAGTYLSSCANLLCCVINAFYVEC